MTRSENIVRRLPRSESVVPADVIDGKLDGTAVQSFAVQQRRARRREEWNEHIELAARLTKYLDPTTTFWTSLENKPPSLLSGIFQKKRGVRPGLPDVFVLHRGRAIFLELKSRSGIASEAQK